MIIRSVVALTLIALLGWGLWVGIVAVSSVKEAWDHPLFFVVAVPLLIGASALAAWTVPRTKYFAGVAAIALQFAWLLWTTPRPAWPLALVGGAISFGAIAIVCTATSIVAGTIRARQT